MQRRPYFPLSSTMVFAGLATALISSGTDMVISSLYSPIRHQAVLIIKRKHHNSTRILSKKRPQEASCYPGNEVQMRQACGESPKDTGNGP